MEQWLPWYPGQESGAWGRRLLPRKETGEVWSEPLDIPRTLCLDLTHTHTHKCECTHTPSPQQIETNELALLCFSEQRRPNCCCCRPGVLPSSATCSMGTFNSCAMKPMTEKMTNPANILVALLVHVTIIVSLQGRRRGKRETEAEWANYASVTNIQEQYSKHATCDTWCRIWPRSFISYRASVDTQIRGAVAPSGGRNTYWLQIEGSESVHKGAHCLKLKNISAVLSKCITWLWFHVGGAVAWRMCVYNIWTGASSKVFL